LHLRFTGGTHLEGRLPGEERRVKRPILRILVTSQQMKLLLNPQQLTKGLRVLQSLHIDKTAGKAGYETSSLNNREIKTTFKALPENAKKILSLFDEKNT